MSEKLKLSKKQREVMAILRNGKGHKLHWLGGLKPHCFLSSNMKYSVSVATAMKLCGLGLVAPDDDKTTNCTLLLTELGKSIDL